MTMNTCTWYDPSLLLRVNRAHKKRFGSLPERCELWCPRENDIPQEADTFHDANRRTRWVLTAHTARWLYDKEPVRLDTRQDIRDDYYEECKADAQSGRGED